MNAPEPYRGSSTDEVYVLLRKRITLGEYGPNARLKEMGLAQELGISRTPIRAAFQRLITEGMLTPAPNRGVIVTPWTDRDNDEVFDLRAQLESHAAALAAERRAQVHVDELHTLNRSMAQLLSDRGEDFRTELQENNRLFHQTVVKAAASPRLASFVGSLADVRRVIGAFFYYTDAEFNNSLEDHIAITRAIERGNSNVARALMDAHIRTTWARFKAQRSQATDHTPLGDTP
ncbi:GntR family transcriptional regulator [Burkholderia dolosa]|uniref:GntR family transcriptional regulator n=1 Tax=Burkholderia dolosa TaxID=152500 RepID=UPI001B9A8AE4|nr:GntR family transcriptional regulator [Burkholderia dolosa]MBR8457090.1 GntR family transcriptional regulator [Burkholderia dolosa]MDN7419411.1 GntR family transcriptional regulator [Burkholderia dolosa]